MPTLPENTPRKTAPGPGQPDAVPALLPTSRSLPSCPECGAGTEPLGTGNGEVFRCLVCGRRTLGTGDEEDDHNLDPYEEDGICYHGNGEIDVEATGELQSQYGPDDDEEDEEGEGDGGEPGPSPAGPPAGTDALPAGAGGPVMHEDRFLPLDR
ncbi:hypothetical protein ABZW18_26235 [Streptomyces sp. NPDC004647]|uniref:hypothetical protein n=1 Tax=Streptomyces sp. NPDC004647 TaxID=3154671 RepID=UPI0033A1B8B4